MTNLYVIVSFLGKGTDYWEAIGPFEDKAKAETYLKVADLKTYHCIVPLKASIPQRVLDDTASARAEIIPS